MTNKRKKHIRELATDLGIGRRAAASRLDANRSAPATGAAYAGPRGDAAPTVPLRELWVCVSAGVVKCDFDSGAWTVVEPPPSGAPAELVARCQSAPYLEAMEKNSWAAEARDALAQIAHDIATAYAETVRNGAPALCVSAAPTPPTVPAPGKRVLAADQFGSDPGWRSIMFAMDQPIFFQYRVETGDRAYTASARGSRRERDGSTTDVTLVLRGRLDDAGELWTTAIEETWNGS